MRKVRKIKKKEYFSFMITPGSNAPVRFLSISKGVIKSIPLALMGILLLSAYMLFEYNDMKHKLYKITSVSQDVQGGAGYRQLGEVVSYWSGPEVNFRPVLIFMGSILLFALIFYAIIKLIRMRMASRVLTIKNRLVEDYYVALNNSPINPNKSKGRTYDRKK